MTSSVDETMSDDAIERRVREAFEVIVPLLDTHRGVPSRRARSAQGRASRVTVGVAAGVVALAGIAGGLAVVGRDDRQGSDTVAPPPTQVVASSATGTAPPAADIDGEASDPADDVQWFLPAALPEGFELTDITAELDVHGTPNPDLGGGVEVVATPPPPIAQMWVRRGADGMTNEDTIVAEATPNGNVAAPMSSAHADGSVSSDGTTAEPDSLLMAEPNTTVHGHDAVIIGPPHRESPGWTVNWIESGMNVTIQATGGVSQVDALAAAEATTVTPDSVTIEPSALPVGFEAVTNTATMGAGGRREAVTLVLRTPAHQSVAIRIDTPPIASLDALAINETERRTINGVDYSLSESDDTLWSRVVWIADGRQFEASGAATVDDLVSVATEIRPVTRSDTTSAAAGISDTIEALPTIGATTLTDGLQVSIHSISGDTGVDGIAGICIHRPQPQCIAPHHMLQQPNVPTLAANAVVFNVDGDRRLITWTGTEPELHDDGTPMPDLVAATSGIGWFVDQHTPAGEPLRGFGFRADDGSWYGVSSSDTIRP